MFWGPSLHPLSQSSPASPRTFRLISGLLLKASFLKLGMCNICKNNIVKNFLAFVTSLAKEVMFLVALVSLSVCLFVCLSVDNITQKVMNGLG